MNRMEFEYQKNKEYKKKEEDYSQLTPKNFS